MQRPSTLPHLNQSTEHWYNTLTNFRPLIGDVITNEKPKLLSSERVGLRSYKIYEKNPELNEQIWSRQILAIRECLQHLMTYPEEISQYDTLLRPKHHGRHLDGQRLKSQFRFAANEEGLLDLSVALWTHLNRSQSCPHISGATKMILGKREFLENFINGESKTNCYDLATLIQRIWGMFGVQSEIKKMHGIHYVPVAEHGTAIDLWQVPQT